jgi:hypothetical protein
MEYNLCADHGSVHIVQGIAWFRLNPANFMKTTPFSTDVNIWRAVMLDVLDEITKTSSVFHSSCFLSIKSVLVYSSLFKSLDKL